MTRTRMTLIPVLVALAAVAAGCFSIIKDDSAEQVDVLNPVRVSTTVCPFGGLDDLPLRSAGARRLVRAIEDAGEDCATHDELYDIVFGGGFEEAVLLTIPRQLMLAYRVPEGSEPPSVIGAHADVLRMEDIFDLSAARVGENRITAPRLHDEYDELPAPVEQHVTFRRADELAGSMPEYYDEYYDLDGPLVGDGEKLVTYVSEVVPGLIVDEFDVRADFGLPWNEDGTPFSSPFQHETFLGMRIAFDEDLIPVYVRNRARAVVRAEDDWPLDPSRPVVCGLDGPLSDLTLCPVPQLAVDHDINEVLGSTDTTTRDLRIAGGGPVTVEQGQTASVPFTIRTAGPAGDEVALGADVSIQDGVATPQDATWPFLATGEHQQLVDVQVPHYTEPGEYVVRLVASAGTQSRDGIATLIVTPRPVQEVEQQVSPPPVVRTPDNLYFRKGRVRFGYICGVSAEACAKSVAELWVDPSAFGARANAAQSTEAGGLVKIATRKFSAKADQRVVRAFRLGRRARAALLGGRSLSGRLIIRSGADSAAPAVQTRGVIVRIRRPQ